MYYVLMFVYDRKSYVIGELSNWKERIRFRIRIRIQFLSLDSKSLQSGKVLFSKTVNRSISIYRRRRRYYNLVCVWKNAFHLHFCTEKHPLKKIWNLYLNSRNQTKFSILSFAGGFFYGSVFLRSQKGHRDYQQQLFCLLKAFPTHIYIFS